MNCLYLTFLIIHLGVSDVLSSSMYSILQEKNTENYKLPELPFGYSDLEPYIDEATVRAHYLGHHKKYTDNMNNFLGQFRASFPELEIHRDSLIEMLKNIDKVPETFRQSIRNQMGGYVNHLLYWSVISPHGNITSPTTRLLKEIKMTFGSFVVFKERFFTVAASVFGSGYAWLSRNSKNELIMSFTANQDCPLSQGQYPLLVIDVWEHAYYLKHQFRRPSHIADWWNLLDWNEVDALDNFWKELRYVQHQRRAEL